VDRDYDLFESLPDGSIVWKAVARGRDDAVAKLNELGRLSPNEHFAIHTPTMVVIARVNEPTAGGASEH
jgi:hypothetical protein